MQPPSFIVIQLHSGSWFISIGFFNLQPAEEYEDKDGHLNGLNGLKGLMFGSELHLTTFYIPASFVSCVHSYSNQPPMGEQFRFAGYNIIDGLWQKYQCRHSIVKNESKGVNQNLLCCNHQNVLQSLQPNILNVCNHKCRCVVPELSVTMVHM